MHDEYINKILFQMIVNFIINHMSHFFDVIIQFMIIIIKHMHVQNPLMIVEIVTGLNFWIII